MSTVIDHTHPALRRPEAPTAFQMGWEGLTDVEPPAEWPREARRAWMADWRAGHRARTSTLWNLWPGQRRRKPFRTLTSSSPKWSNQGGPDIWPSLDQINAERRISLARQSSLTSRRWWPSSKSCVTSHAGMKPSV